MERSTNVIIESLSSLEILRLISSSLKQISFKYLDALKELHLYLNDVKIPTDFFNHLPNIEKFVVKSQFKSFEFNKLDKRVCIRNMKQDKGIFHIFMIHFCHQIEKLYPNPVTDLLFMELSAAGIVQYSIYDALGRVSHHQIVQTGAQGSLVLDIQSLATGVHFIEIRNETGGLIGRNTFYKQ